MRGFFWLCAAVPVLFLVNAFYNVHLHPLRHVPGPFWAKASGIPSWYYTVTGKRHIWLWQLFQIYGKRIRVAPNLVLFCDPEAHADIYGMKSNVRRSPFYVALTKDIREQTTLTTIDPTEHAKRRKMLNTAFTDISVHTAAAFMSQHIDRWHQIMLDEHDNTTEWSASMDLSKNIDHLVFDIMGDLSFGRSFNTKELGDNPLKEVPYNTINYLKFFYPNERRQDMFYFLCQARGSSEGHAAYTEDELRAEALLLIIAGSDTTTASLASIFWYLVRAPRSYQKLVNELQRTFRTAEDATYGPKLTFCTYLRACIDEGMRLVPPGPCEPPREILAGGLKIMNNHYPKGTIVGTAPWCDSRNEEVYGDPGIFRPERWIVDEAAGVTKEMVADIRTNFHPFLTGPGSCAGKNIAMAEIMLVVAKTLLIFDIRKAPGSTLGEGSPELGWGERDKKQFQVVDAYVSVKQGPEVQYRKRASPKAESG
ncbi:hypothetical protein JX265_012778 [Neoarthrinium moseri]|uniref:Cytochrome P450 n=1 Tax=Neoarthrinium moseri TaxID=1658444 RepID=A0A9P9WA16_9PEZI|nr:hypothetical protein JX265_012778 [Neoarthrinium moseri]